MRFVGREELLMLIALPVDLGISSHLQLLWILFDLKVYLVHIVGINVVFVGSIAVFLRVGGLVFEQYGLLGISGCESFTSKIFLRMCICTS